MPNMASTHTEHCLDLFVGSAGRVVTGGAVSG
jgi:hypothetical protein